MTIFLCIESTIWGQKGVSIQCAANTIMLHSCDVENCEDTSATMVEKGETLKKGRTYCVAGAPDDVSYKNDTILSNKSSCMAKMDVF